MKPVRLPDAESLSFIRRHNRQLQGGTTAACLSNWAIGVQPRPEEREQTMTNTVVSVPNTSDRVVNGPREKDAKWDQVVNGPHEEDEKSDRVVNGPREEDETRERAT